MPARVQFRRNLEDVKIICDDDYDCPEDISCKNGICERKKPLHASKSIKKRNSSNPNDSHNNRLRPKERLISIIAEGMKQEAKKLGMVDICSKPYSSIPRDGGSELDKLKSSLESFRDKYSGFSVKFSKGYYVDPTKAKIGEVIKDIEKKNKWVIRTFSERLNDWWKGNEVNTASYCLDAFFNNLAKIYVTGKLPSDKSDKTKLPSDTSEPSEQSTLSNAKDGGGSRKYKKHKKKRKNNKKTKRRKPRSKVRSKKSKTKRVRKIR